jgi:hypothetical protein
MFTFGPSSRGGELMLAPPNVASNTGWWNFTNPAAVFKMGIRATPIAADDDVITYVEAYDNGTADYWAVRKTDVIGIGIYKTSVVNGKPIRRMLDTTNSLSATFEKYRKSDLVSQGSITSTMLFSAGGKTVVMAISIDSVGAANPNPYANHPILGDDGNRFQIGCQNFDAGNVTVRPYNYDGTEDSVSLNVPKSTWMVLSVRHDGTNLSIRRNGGAWTSAASGATNTYTGNVFLGQAGTSGQTLLDMAHLATFNTALSDANTRAVEAYMADQIGISLS